MRHAPLASLTLLAALTGCGSERELSGVWRQTACEDGLARDDCSGFVYELHIGRYGDDVAGLVVRYVYDRSGFGNFQRPRECGCFFIEGGRATDERLEFRLFDTGTPRYPQPDTADRDLACATPDLLTTCTGRQFVLEGDGDDADRLHRLRRHRRPAHRLRTRRRPGPHRVLRPRRRRTMSPAARRPRPHARRPATARQPTAAASQRPAPARPHPTLPSRRRALALLAALLLLPQAALAAPAGSDAARLNAGLPPGFRRPQIVVYPLVDQRPLALDGRADPPPPPRPRGTPSSTPSATPPTSPSRPPRSPCAPSPTTSATAARSSSPRPPPTAPTATTARSASTPPPKASTPPSTPGSSSNTTSSPPAKSPAPPSPAASRSSKPATPSPPSARSARRSSSTPRSASAPATTSPAPSKPSTPPARASSPKAPPRPTTSPPAPRSPPSAPARTSSAPASSPTASKSPSAPPPASASRPNPSTATPIDAGSRLASRVRACLPFGWAPRTVGHRARLFLDAGFDSYAFAHNPVEAFPNVGVAVHLSWLAAARLSLDLHASLATGERDPQEHLRQDIATARLWLGPGYDWQSDRFRATAHVGVEVATMSPVVLTTNAACKYWPPGAQVPPVLCDHDTDIDRFDRAWLVGPAITLGGTVRLVDQIYLALRVTGATYLFESADNGFGRPIGGSLALGYRLF
ncbi:MAG: hypothetical protein H6705_06885 [Myxococcales bacterium]|nr:hypothetical protein [Myxococcales bacterium]